MQVSRVSGSVFALALALRLLAIWISGPDAVAFRDGADYIAHASAVCSGGPYPDRGNSPIFRPPGFPVFIAAATACHPDAVIAIKIGLAILDAATVVLIGLLAGLLWKDRRVVVLASAWAAFHPVFLLQVSDVRSEGLFTFLLTLALLLALDHHERRGRFDLWTGIVSGVAALTRPSALAVIPFLAAVRMTGGGAARRRRWRAAILVMLGAATPIAPWTARNLVRYGEVIVVNDAFGFNFWRGSSPLAEAAVSADGEEAAEALTSFGSRGLHVKALVDANADSPGARSRLWLAYALEGIREDPGAYARFTALKLVTYWRPWLNPRFHPTPRVVLSALAIVPLFAFGLAGLVRLRARDRRAFVAVAAFLLLGWLAHAPFLVAMRLRTPFTDPILLALASEPLIRIASALRATARARALPAAR